MPRALLLLVLLAIPLSSAGAAEQPFYQVEKNGTGPLTLKELQISIPKDLDKMLTKQQRACAIQQVETLAAQAGDPETLDPAKVDYLSMVTAWPDLTRYNKRLILAQALISRAFALCV